MHREALVHYVKYLSIRGEVERFLIWETSEQNGQPLLGALKPDATDQEKAAHQEELKTVTEIVKEVFQNWIVATQHDVDIPQPPVLNDEQLAKSRQRGRELFHGNVAVCSKCHQEKVTIAPEFDDWTKEALGWTRRDINRRELLALGMLEPQPVKPLDLKLGIYRGGNQPSDLYRRIVFGIDGSTMGGVPLKRVPEEQGILVEEVWDLVNYVLSLPTKPE